jgi:hypothetical protein
MNMLLRLLGLEHGTEVHRIVDSGWRVTQPVPSGVLYAVVILGACLALVNFLPKVSMRASVRIWTFLLRLAMLGALLVVLYGIEWHLGLELNEKQHWVLLVDDSASMAPADVDGKSRFSAALEDMKRVREAVQGRADLTVATVSGRALGDEPGQGPTLFRSVVARHALSRSSVDRLVILTDGRDSERRDLRQLGEDLRARDIRLSVRLYGSKTAPVDAVIMAEPERTVLRLGEDLVVRGSVAGKLGAGDHTVALREDGRDVKTFAVSAETSRRFELRHRPEKKGRHVYTLELLAEDALKQNNQTRFAADVVEEKINVLLIEGSPRFEFKLVKAPLEVDPLVNLVSICHIPGGGVFVQGKPLHKKPEQGLISSQAELFKYDVIILRDISRSYFREGGDTTESRLQNIVQFVTKRGGGLVVLGGQDVFRAGGYQDSHLAEVLPFDLSDRISSRDQFEGLFFVMIPKPAYQHPILRLLPELDTNRERLNSLRQLDGSNNVGDFKPMATSLMTRTVSVKAESGKPVEKQAPIMGTITVGEGKVLAAAVDTLWRWQLQPDFDDPPLTFLLANTVRYLAPLPGRKPGAPNVALADMTPQVGQEFLLSTDLKDSNFEPIRNADLVVTVARPDGTSYRMCPRDLPEEPGHYEYRVFIDQPGRYSVTAKFDKHESTREFLAGAAAGEFADLSVDREGINRLVEAAAGEIFDDTATWLRSVDMQPARKAAVRDLEAWNSPLILLLFTVFVCVDCYIRKRQGLV